jgi:hypothetical protein
MDKLAPEVDRKDVNADVEMLSELELCLACGGMGEVAPY